MGNGRVEFLCMIPYFLIKVCAVSQDILRADPSSLCIEQVIIIGAAFMIVSAIPFKTSESTLPRLELSEIYSPCQ